MDVIQTAKTLRYPYCHKKSSFTRPKSPSNITTSSFRLAILVQVASRQFQVYAFIFNILTQVLQNDTTIVSKSVLRNKIEKYFQLLVDCIIARRV